VQAKKKIGGRSFMCAESSAWRKDSKCSESASDFMTAGERFGEVIPAVPNGFVRWVQLSSINEPNKRKHVKTDRTVYYIYCGEGDTVPDTRGWEPFGAQLAAAMADRRGSQLIHSLRHPKLLSVKSILKENPVLVSEGVTLDDFSFSRAKSTSTATVAPSQVVASSVQQPSPEPPVPPAAAPLEAATPFAQPSCTPNTRSGAKRKAMLVGYPSSDGKAELAIAKVPRTSSEAEAVCQHKQS
jgi:hypothetical protein